MTAFTIIQSFNAAAFQRHEDMAVIAYRTALFTRMKHTHFPKSEADLLKKPKAAKPKAQSLKDQLAMAKFVTSVMSKAKH